VFLFLFGFLFILGSIHMTCDTAKATSYLGRLAQTGAGTDPFLIPLTNGSDVVLETKVLVSRRLEDKK